MADRTIQERLQPSLLDRLTADAPEERLERRESRVIAVRRLRELIRRDLAWLLNTTNQERRFGEEFPNVATSTLNFGVQEVAGEFDTGQRAVATREAIKLAIERFEPRIVANSVRVDLRQPEDASDPLIYFDIRADMWAQPLPMELYMRSENNIVTGELKLERVS